MRLHISREGLRAGIAADPELPVEVGSLNSLSESLGMFVPHELVDEPPTHSEPVELRIAFGTLVGLLRRRMGLDIAELAARARVAEEEILEIENRVGLVAKPRTVHHLAGVFGLPAQTLLKLSGATITNDEKFKEAAVRFAAKSGDMSKLTKHEKEALHEYVKFLDSQADG